MTEERPFPVGDTTAWSTDPVPGLGGERQMATIVLVHGIAQEQRSAAELETEWLPSLAWPRRRHHRGGVRSSGDAVQPDQAEWWS